MKAVIVAAGRGKRMMPLTADTPKPLLRIRGIPLLEYLLRGLCWADVKDIAIVVGYLGEQIEKTFGDGAALGLELTYIRQEGPDGTGSACLAAREFVGDVPFLLLWGDILMEPENYRRIQEDFARKPCDLLSALNAMEDTSSGASVETKDDRIVRIVEKPPAGTARSNLNQAGLFVCTDEVLHALQGCELSPRGELEFTSGVQRMIESGKLVRWMPVEGFWSDVGTPEVVRSLENDDRVTRLLR